MRRAQGLVRSSLHYYACLMMGFAQPGIALAQETVVPTLPPPPLVQGIPPKENALPSPLDAPPLPAQDTPGSAPVALSPTPVETELCPVNWIGKVLQRASSRSVWIATPSWGATGVLVSKRYVATSGAGFALGRGPFQVRFADDRTVSARIATFDEQDDIVILELDSPATLEPLESANPKDLPKGTPLLAIAQPAVKFDAPNAPLFRSSPVVGYLAGVSQDNFVVTVPEQLAGAPIMGCDGKWYGMLLASRRQLAVSAARLLAASKKVHAGDHYLGRWSAGSGRFGLAEDFGRQQLLIGFQLGFSVKAYDRLDLRLDFGLLGLYESKIPQSGGGRVFADLGVGYRLLLSAEPLWYLVPAVGVGFTQDSFTPLMRKVDPNCTSTNCALEPIPRTTDTGNLRGYWFTRLGLSAAGNDLALSLRFGGEPHDTTVHLAFTLGQP